MSINLIKFLIKLKNASLSKKEIVTLEYNPLCLELLHVLYSEGLIQTFSVEQLDGKIFLKICLRYFFNKPVLKNLKLFSKPSHVKYVRYSDLCKIVDRKFIFVLSTNQGILTSLECKKKKIGGKLLFMC